MNYLLIGINMAKTARSILNNKSRPIQKRVRQFINTRVIEHTQPYSITLLFR